MAFERLRADLKLDTSGFRSGVKDVRRDWDSLQDRAESTGQSMQKAGEIMRAGITAPIAAIGSGSIETASNVEEMEARFNEVFESSADRVEAWVQTHADEIGRSENQLKEYATDFGSLLNAMGTTEEQSAGMSQQLTELTADLASFNNQSEEQVQQNLESALVGESQAVQEYGIDLSGARVEQQLMNDGLAASREEATEAELAQARLNAIMEQTEDAQGHAARTSDLFANRMRDLRGDTEELRAEIGEHLLPIATGLVNLLSSLIGWFNGLSDTQQKVIVITGGLVAAIGPLLLGIGKILAMLPAAATGFGMVAGAITNTVLPALGSMVTTLAPILAVLAALTTAAYVLYRAWRGNWLGIRDILNWALGPITDGIDWIIDKLFGISDATEKVAGYFGDFIDWLIGLVNKIPGINIDSDSGEVEIEAETDEGEVDETMELEEPAEVDDFGEDLEEEFEGIGEQSGQSFSDGFSNGLVESLDTEEIREEGISQIEEEIEAVQEDDSLSIHERRQTVDELEDEIKELEEAEDITDFDRELVVDVADQELQEEREEAEALQEVYDELEERDVDVEGELDPTQYDQIDVGHQVDDLMAAEQDPETDQSGDLSRDDLQQAFHDALDQFFEGRRFTIEQEIDHREIRSWFKEQIDAVLT
ncbi:phage tail tape measure protein [Halopiger goleimassiliensis]|uniref:phage tail tape measure protein n=1 Tax=Halopiger goleimassiliensis TaxID=1293048 RepID=UPI0006778D37|nr:phage tail tape measure protein [Halopiger goleimassiliensis]